MAEMEYYPKNTVIMNGSLFDNISAKVGRRYKQLITAYQGCHGNLKIKFPDFFLTLHDRFDKIS